jgi:type VI protein secretion system component VasF
MTDQQVEKTEKEIRRVATWIIVGFGAVLLVIFFSLSKIIEQSESRIIQTCSEVTKKEK